MRPVTAAVSNFLNSVTPLTRWSLPDLYTFTLIGGEVLRFSGAQESVNAPAPNTGSPLLNWARGPKFTRKKTKIQIGVQVDELEIDIDAAETDLLGGTLTWQQAIHGGVFDGAICELDRCVMSPPGTVIGTINWFYGRVANIDTGRTKITMKVKSLLDLLTVQMPRRLYQAQCTFVFGDTMCGYNRVTGIAADGTLTGIGQQTIAAQSGSTQNSIITTFVPNPLTAYNQGTIIGVTGANSGYMRTIGALVSGTIYFLAPWLHTVTIGDTFHLLPGCDHTLGTCTNTFQNNNSDGSRYGGFPFIPPPETAI